MAEREPVIIGEIREPKEQPVELKVQTAKLGSSRFDILYADLRLNSVPNRVILGEWEL